MLGTGAAWNRLGRPSWFLGFGILDLGFARLFRAPALRLSDHVPHHGTRLQPGGLQSWALNFVGRQEAGAPKALQAALLRSAAGPPNACPSPFPASGLAPHPSHCER